MFKTTNQTPPKGFVVVVVVAVVSFLFFLLKSIWVWRIFQVFVHAAVYLLVVKFLKQFQTDEVDQNHLDWMGFVFSCWKVYGFEEYFRFLFMLLFIYWLWSLKKNSDRWGWWKIPGCCSDVLLQFKSVLQCFYFCFSIIMLFWSGVYYNMSFLHVFFFFIIIN